MKSETEKLIREKFVRLVTDARIYPETPRKKILLLSIPRSGSSLVCDLLRLTGTFGTPDEWLNTRYFVAYNELFRNGKTKIEDYINFLFENTTSSNGVFSIKIHISQFQFWRSVGFEPMSLGFDHVFFLYRRDKIAQAVSLATSEITDIWSDVETGENHKDFRLTKKQFVSALTEINNQEVEFLTSYSSKTDATFCYEELIGPDAPNIFSQFFTKSGLPVPQGMPVSELKKQTGFSKKRNVAFFKAQIAEKGIEAFLREPEQTATEQPAPGMHRQSGFQ